MSSESCRLRHGYAVEAENLGKAFRIINSQRQLVSAVLRPGSGGERFWALKNVSFALDAGETVGIIGRNGSGKSTLLQLICGILTPTTGQVRSQGRIAPLLELGTGFNPQFSGRENVFINGSLLGIGTQELKDNYDAIVSFADIGPFIDQAVRTYSSGMLVRLGFAIATSVRPDLLIVDEALAVGDERFQRKCFARLRQLKDEGSTILFVSHSNQNIIDLCTRALLLDGGELITMGAPKWIIGNYQKLLHAPTAQRNALKQALGSPSRNQEPIVTDPELSASTETANKAWFDPDLQANEMIEFESQGARIGTVRIQTRSGEQVNTLITGQLYTISYEVNFDTTVEGAWFSLMLKTMSGFHLGGAKTAAHSFAEEASTMAAGSSIRVSFDFDCRLNPGTYDLNVAVFGLVDHEQTFVARCIDAAVFKVMASGPAMTSGPVQLLLGHQVSSVTP